MSTMQRHMLRLLGARPISFNPELARLTGSISSGLLLCQFLYWQNVKGDGEWFYKTQTEIESETCLSRRESDAARLKLRDMGVLEEERRGVPCQLYYRLNLEALGERIDENRQSSLAKTDEPDATKPPIQFGENRQSSLANTAKHDATIPPNPVSESTQESTAETTTESTHNASARSVPPPSTLPFRASTGSAKPVNATDADVGDLARAIVCAHPRALLRSWTPEECPYSDLTNAIDAMDAERSKTGCTAAEAGAFILERVKLLAEKVPRGEWRFLKPPGDFLRLREYRMEPEEFTRASNVNESKPSFAEAQRAREQQEIDEARARRANRG